MPHKLDDPSHYVQKNVFKGKTVYMGTSWSNHQICEKLTVTKYQCLYNTILTYIYGGVLVV